MNYKIIIGFCWMSIMYTVVSATDLEINTSYNPIWSNVTYQLNATFRGLTTVEVNETCLVLNDTHYCNQSSTDIVIFIGGEPDVASPSDLSITVVKTDNTELMANCSASDESPPITYDLWIEDTDRYFTWDSSSGMLNCNYTFDDLWPRVTYQISMNATDALGNRNNYSIFYYLNARIGVHVGS